MSTLAEERRYKAEELKSVCLDSFPEAESDAAVSFAVEVRVPAEHGGNYLVRKRYRTPREIYQKLHKALDKSVCECGNEFKPKKWDVKCPKCGEGSDHRYELVDEYDSCCHFGDDEHKEVAPRDWHMSSVAVWCETGGNEGYSVYVTLHLYKDGERAFVNVYRIKSFRGMRHCHNLVERIMKLCGVWPEYCKD